MRPRHAATKTSALGPQPALDGIRGLAVAAVVAFHLGYPWAKGGYLGVSVFFTLSGFLITTRLLEERGSTGATDLRRFWSRRARRLLPAALCGLVLAALVAHADANATASARGDIVAALGDVANWRFLLTGRSYAALFTAPSPVLHFWSLSIEEQFYLLFPLAFALLLRTRDDPARLLRWLLGALAVSWTTLTIAGLAGAQDFAYYATPARAGELLVGAALAVVFVPGHVARPGRRSVVLVRRATGFAAIGLLAVLTVVLSQTSTWLYVGGLPLIAILSALLIVAACRPGPLRAALRARPLVALGRVSFGVYVYHWPILLWLTPARTGWHGIGLDGARLAATFALAVPSYHLLERPIRDGRAVRTRLARPLLLAGYVAVLATTLLIVGTVRPAIDLDRARAALAAPAAPVPPVSASRPALRVSIFGDSTAIMAGWGLKRWGQANDQLATVGGVLEEGCGITRGGRRRYEGGEGAVPASCDAWPTTWPQALQAAPADAAVVLVGPWDVADRELAGQRGWLHVGDPGYDAYLESEMGQAADVLLEHVPAVVWLTSPDIDVGRTDPNPPDPPYPESDPARMARFNDILHEVAATRPNLHVIDLAGYLATLPGGEMDPALRPDGVHLTDASGLRIADWLGPAVITAVRG